MERNIVILFTVVFLALCATSGSSAPNKGAAPASPVSSEDKTGTNPTNIQKQLYLSNEFLVLPDDNVVNKAVLKYTTPINRERSMSLLVGTPFVTTDVGGETDFGFGDLQISWTWINKMTPKYATALAVDSYWNTATKDTLGTGKSTLSPRFFYAMFLKGAIFVPAVLQKFDIGGDSDRADISQTIFDFYYVRPMPQGQWITLDPQLIIDHETNRTSAQTKVTYGRMISGGLSFFVIPSFPMGGNEPIQWGIEVGVKNVF